MEKLSRKGNKFLLAEMRAISACVISVGEITSCLYLWIRKIHLACKRETPQNPLGFLRGFCSHKYGNPSKRNRVSRISNKTANIIDPEDIPHLFQEKLFLGYGQSAFPENHEIASVPL